MENNIIRNTGLNVVGYDDMDKMLKLAQVMAKSSVTIPKHLKNEGDCLAIVMQSAQWGMNPFSVAQKTFTLNGVLGYESQLVSAIINNNAPIKQRLEYEYFGPWENVIGKVQERTSQKGHKYRVSASTPQDEKGVGVIVRATLKGESKPRELKLLLAQVFTRNSTLWAEDPKQQIAYLAAKKWSRLYCPDVILGVYTPDEVEEIVEARTYLTSNIENAIFQLGLKLEKNEKCAYIIGNTFAHSKTLKELGFEYEDERWTILISSNETSFSNEAVIVEEPVNETVNNNTSNENHNIKPKQETQQFQEFQEVTKTEETQNNQNNKSSKDKKEPSPAKQLFSYVYSKGVKKNEQIATFVNEILGLTKEEENEIKEVLYDTEKLDSMINEFKQLEGIEEETK